MTESSDLGGARTAARGRTHWRRTDPTQESVAECRYDTWQTCAESLRHCPLLISQSGVPVKGALTIPQTCCWNTQR
ncbi:hypothetical protein VTK56DRAFT_7560 [Thermocarpiscus australiensis]